MIADHMATTSDMCALAISIPLKKSPLPLVLVVIVLYAAMRAHPEYAAADGCHYNADGVAAQAELLDRALSPRLAAIASNSQFGGLRQ